MVVLSDLSDKYLSDRSDKFRVYLSDRSDKYLSDLSDKFTPEIMSTPVFYCFLHVCYPAGLSFSQVGFLVMVGRGCPVSDCLKSCVLYIDSDGAGGKH